MSIIVTLRDAPNKMSTATIEATEAKFTTLLTKALHTPDALVAAFKAYQTALDADVPLSTEAQRAAMLYQKSYIKAAQAALGGYKANDETHFDVQIIDQ